MVSQGRIDRQIGEVLSDGLGHVTDHLDHHVCRELIWRDMRWAVTGGQGRQEEAVRTRLSLTSCRFINAGMPFMSVTRRVEGLVASGSSCALLYYPYLSLLRAHRFPVR